MSTLNDRHPESPSGTLATGEQADQARFPRLPEGGVDVPGWIAALGMKPICSLAEVVGQAWPADDRVEEFLQARRGWRQDDAQDPGN